MGKKLADIEKEIKSSSKLFKEYLSNNLDDDAIEFVKKISKKNDIYIFSGVIRNFFLKKKEIRDLDIVVTSIKKIENIIKKYSYTKNSFGGYKISVNNLNIDLWELTNTWALNYQPNLFEEDNLNLLHKTSFFNFSSIVYNYNDEYFNFSKDFQQFLQTKKLDVVFPANPNISLCVINTVYYSEKFNLGFGTSLKKFLNNLNLEKIDNLENVQIKHFGEVKYSNEFIINKITQIRNHKDKPTEKKEYPIYLLFSETNVER